MLETGSILTGVTTESFQRMAKGPGVMIKGFDYRSATTFAELFHAYEEALQAGQGVGATNGGISITIQPNYVRRETDHAGHRFPGDEMLESWTCEMSASLQEITAETLQNIYPTAEFTEVGDDIVAGRIRSDINPETDYHDFSFIVTTDYGMAMITMFRCLGRTTGAAQTDNEGLMEFPWQCEATGSENLEERAYAPCEIWLAYRNGRVVRHAVGDAA